MSSKLANITSNALQLPKDERVELAKSILDSLGENEPIYEKEWLEVVKERRENYKTGKSPSISWEETKAKLHQRVKDQ